MFFIGVDVSIGVPFGYGWRGGLGLFLLPGSDTDGGGWGGFVFAAGFGYGWQGLGWLVVWGWG